MVLPLIEQVGPGKPPLHSMSRGVEAGSCAMFGLIGRSRVEFGVTLFPDFGHERLLELARLAEAGGLDYLGIADSQSLARDVYVALAALARDTRRIRIGLTVTNPLTRHPAVTASAIASVDEACG